MSNDNVHYLAFSNERASRDDHFQQTEPELLSSILHEMAQRQASIAQEVVALRAICALALTEVCLQSSIPSTAADRICSAIMGLSVATNHHASSCGVELSSAAQALLDVGAQVKRSVENRLL
jgi:hypothetical protein